MRRTQLSHFAVNRRHDSTSPCFLAPPVFVQAAALTLQPSSSAGRSCPDWPAPLLLLMTPTGKQERQGFKIMHALDYIYKKTSKTNQNGFLYCSVCQLFADTQY